MSGLADVTPVLLTFNEEANLQRALNGLSWAASIVIVDSGSTDGSEAIARAYPSVRWVVRPFDTHARQWTFAIHETGIETPYVLALDADYAVTPAFTEELGRALNADVAGGVAGFDYQIDGSSLSGSVYPAKLVVFKRDAVRISQPGHSQEFAVDGPVYQFHARLVHDDRKPLERFVASQMQYSRLELARLQRNPRDRWQDRVRASGWMPIVAGIGAYIRSGGPFRGRASLRYAYERAIFECLLALRVLSTRAEEDSRAPRESEHATDRHLAGGRVHSRAEPSSDPHAPSIRRSDASR